MKPCETVSQLSTVAINGWDLQKALRLLHSSNPTLFEWNNSPIVYKTTPEWAEMGKEELRAFLGQKSLAGHRDTIQALIRKYGGQKFSDIDPKHYPALQKDAEGLPDAT